MSNEERPARVVVVVGHGSRAPAANADVAQMCELVRAELADGSSVVPAYLELAEPSVGRAIDDAIASGAREVIVHPYFLSAGRHAKEDVPRLVAEARLRHPTAEIRATQALGVHPLLARLVVERISATGTDREKP